MVLLNRQMAKGGSLPARDRWPALAAGFVCGLVATCAAIHAALPLRPDVPVISAKLEALAARGAGAGYDTLFLGTSRTFHQVSPAIFDRTLGEHGVASHSFNLGADGMNFPETFFVLDAALARLARPPRLVVIELGAMQWGDNGLGVNADSLRALYWHTPATTWLVWDSMLRRSPAPQPWPVTLQQAAAHAGLLVRNCGNLGRAPEVLPAFNPANRRQTTPPAAQDGFSPVDRTMSPAQQRDFETRLAERQQAGPLPRQHDPALGGAFTRLVENLRRRGTQTLFVLMPAFRRDLPVLPVDASGQPVPVIDLDQPQRDPALWQAGHRYDPHHLNRAGAEIFTRLLAEAVARQLQPLASR